MLPAQGSPVAAQEWLWYTMVVLSAVQSAAPRRALFIWSLVSAQDLDVLKNNKDNKNDDHKSH